MIRPLTSVCLLLIALVAMDVSGVEICATYNDGGSKRPVCTRDFEFNVPPDYGTQPAQKGHAWIHRRVEPANTVPNFLAPGAMGQQGAFIAETVVGSVTAISSVAASFARADQERAQRYYPYIEPAGLSPEQKAANYAAFCQAQALKRGQADALRVATFERSADYREQEQRREKFKETFQSIAQQLSSPTIYAEKNPTPKPSLNPREAYLEGASAIAELLDHTSYGTSPASQRWRERAERARNYWSNEHTREAMSRLRLSPRAEAAFDLPQMQSDSFEISEIIRTANQLSREPLITSNPTYSLQVSFALKQAAYFAKEGEILSSSMMIENALSVRDFIYGLTSGVGQNLFDTATGLWHVVTHPIDSAQAIGNAIINYEATYDLIANKVRDVIDKFPTMTAEERGALIGYLATEILTTVGTGGAGLAADAAKVAKAAHLVKGVELVVENAATLFKASGMATVLPCFQILKVGNRFIAPKLLKAFPNTIEVRPKSSVQGGGARRARWYDPETKETFEWDSRHGAVERYSKRGVHIGEFDALDGRQLKPADPTRKLER